MSFVPAAYMRLIPAESVTTTWTAINVNIRHGRPLLASAAEAPDEDDLQKIPSEEDAASDEDGMQSDSSQGSSGPGGGSAANLHSELLDAANCRNQGRVFNEIYA